MLDTPMMDDGDGGLGDDSVDPSMSETRLNASCAQLRKPVPSRDVFPCARFYS